MSVELLPLTTIQIAKSIPGSRGAERLNPATVTRWILRGCADLSGKNVKLKATRAGNRWLVYQSDLDAFFAALAADPTDGQAVPSDAAQHDAANAAADRAGKLLQAAGA